MSETLHGNPSVAPNQGFSVEIGELPPLPIAEPFRFGPPEVPLGVPGPSPERGALNLEVLGDAIDWGRMVYAGMSRAVTARAAERQADRAELLEDHAEFYPAAAQASLDLTTPKAPYDPLEKFDAAHRAVRAGFGEVMGPSNARVPYRGTFTPGRHTPEQKAGDAATIPQALYGMRSGLRVDAINKRQHVQEKFESLYGVDLRNKAAVKMALANGRFTHGEKKSIRGASKQVRRAMRSEDRIHNRLTRTIRGTAIGPKVLQMVSRRAANEADRLDRSAQHAGNIEQQRRQKVEQNRRRREHAKQQRRQQRAAHQAQNRRGVI